MLRRKFTVHPQAEVAGYRIDLVVEGNDARLAVECDGDAWHGAERYEQDMARQRQLERAGWTFIRIRESAWYTDREAAIKSVLDACEGLGIRPLEVLEDTRSSIGSVAASRRVDLCSSQSVLAAPAHAAGRNRSQVWDVDESVEADTMRLRWNTRYEASKPRLVDRLEALMRISDDGELPQAERTIAAIRNLPEVGEYGGSVRIENRVARKPGDSDFIYSLFVDDQGFELSYRERLAMEGGQRDYADTMTLVKCNPVGWDSDDESLDEDEEALANMRELGEVMAGRPFSDEEWQMQVEAAREMEEIDLPNGIDRWLEMLPVDDEGKCPKTVSLEWNG